MPLIDSGASIQWDAVDVHYSAQRYFASRVLHGEFPFWTPFLFSGFPFLADPQTGGFYPGNWPFFLTGPTPKAIEGEIAFHALLAAAGVFALLRRWIGPCGAAAGALCYALGGFFAGHSSHIGIFQTASLFPWLLLSFFLAVEGSFWHGALLGALTGSCLILAGHFQTALYAFSGLALAGVAVVVRRRGAAYRSVIAYLLMTIVVSGLLSAIQTLPGLELTARSIRDSADYSASTEGTLEVRSLMTLGFPDSLGAISGDYHGPGDVTQYYFYCGFLALPLAAVGLLNAKVRIYALWLAIPALLYMGGPAWGFFRLISWVPGFRSIRAPVHAWFIEAFALSLLAAAGVEWLASRWRLAGPAVVAVLALDLCIANVWINPLAYARQSWQSLYGDRLSLVRERIASLAVPMTRFQAPDKLGALGPLNGPLDLQLETTYGYNPLTLSAYNGFRDAMAHNSKLRDSLSVSLVLDTSTGAIEKNSSRLPLAYFPQELLMAQDEPGARKVLETLDPPRQTVLIGALPQVQQDPGAQVAIQRDGERTYRAAYSAATMSLLRLAIPSYPGWEATVDGTPCPVLTADYALMAVIVPAGTHQLTLRFHSRSFTQGAALSGCGILLLAGLGIMWWRQRG